MGFLFQVPKAISPAILLRSLHFDALTTHKIQRFPPKMKNSYFFLFTNELIMYIVRSRAQIKTGGMAEW